MEKELDEIILKAKGIKEGYEFYCSIDYKKDIKEYKGIKINFSSLIPNKTIYYSYRIYFDNTK
jgi:hypothetical protein